MFKCHVIPHLPYFTSEDRSAKADRTLYRGIHHAVHTVPPYTPIPDNPPHTTHTLNCEGSFHTLRPRVPCRIIFHPQVGIYHPDPEIMGGSKGFTSFGYVYFVYSRAIADYK